MLLARTTRGRKKLKHADVSDMDESRSIDKTASSSTTGENNKVDELDVSGVDFPP